MVASETPHDARPRLDWARYQAWFLTEGNHRGDPLDEDTWIEDRRKLEQIHREGLDLLTSTPDEARIWLARKRRSLKPGSVNNLSKALARWLRFRDGRPVKLPKWREEIPEDRALDREEIYEALGYTHRDARRQLRARFLTALAVSSGIEPAEAAPLDVEDFDLKRGGVLIEHPCKGHRRRFVPLPKAVLTAPNRASFAVWMKHREIAPDDPDAVFTGRSWRPSTGHGPVERLRPSGLSAILQDVQKQTGVPINFQVARHTWATNLVDAGYSLRHVQKLGGWHGLDIVARYAESRPGQAEEKYRQLKGLDPFR